MVVKPFRNEATTCSFMRIVVGSCIVYVSFLPHTDYFISLAISSKPECCRIIHIEEIFFFKTVEDIQCL